MTTMLSQRDGLKVLTQTLAVSSAERREALDITTDVRDGVRRAGIHKGLVIANCLHTTCSVLVAESGPALLEDFVRLMRRLIDDGKPYRTSRAIGPRASRRREVRSPCTSMCPCRARPW